MREQYRQQLHDLARDLVQPRTRAEWTPFERQEAADYAAGLGVERMLDGLEAHERPTVEFPVIQFDGKEPVEFVRADRVVPIRAIRPELPPAA